MLTPSINALKLQISLEKFLNSLEIYFPFFTSGEITLFPFALTMQKLQLLYHPSAETYFPLIFTQLNISI